MSFPASLYLVSVIDVTVYSGCAPLAPPPTEDFVPYNFLSLAVPPGSCSGLSARPQRHYHGNSGLSLSPPNRAGSSSRPICPHSNYAESHLLSCWTLALEWAFFGTPIVPCSFKNFPFWPYWNRERS